MENNIDYKQLYETLIIEKEKILAENLKKENKILELTEELNKYKNKNYKKSSCEKDMGQIIEDNKKLNTKQYHLWY